MFINVWPVSLLLGPSQASFQCIFVLWYYYNFLFHPQNVQLMQYSWIFWWGHAVDQPMCNLCGFWRIIFGQPLRQLWPSYVVVDNLTTLSTICWLTNSSICFLEEIVTFLQWLRFFVDAGKYNGNDGSFRNTTRIFYVFVITFCNDNVRWEYSLHLLIANLSTAAFDCCKQLDRAGNIRKKYVSL